MKTKTVTTQSFWNNLTIRFNRHRMGRAAAYLFIIFTLAGIYAPFLASSKPLVVNYDGQWYFPFFRYLFYTGYYTKNIDIFFNLLIFIFPAGILLSKFFRSNAKAKWACLILLAVLQTTLFFTIIFSPRLDPAANLDLIRERQRALKDHPYPDWNFDLKYMTPYAKLNLLLRQQQLKLQHESWLPYEKQYGDYSRTKGLPTSLPSLWANQLQLEKEDISRQNLLLKSASPESPSYQYAAAKAQYLQQRRQWIDQNLAQLQFEVLPLISYFHWEDDAGGDQILNQFLPWWKLSRINRKDLVSALIFGIRISLVVGILSVSIALLIGIPIGAFSGYYGGSFDIIVCRLLEIWESMPTFFMLLFVVAILQSKSIFLVILVIGIFGWTTISRYVRGEFFKQRNLTYVEACQAVGFSDSFTIFSYILPNAIPPVLTLLPFAVMGAISSEAGLSFLGLGEEGSCSWGVLMDEGRRAFPGESRLLWPPAMMLTLLLLCIALIGDALRDALDPKLNR